MSCRKKPHSENTPCNRFSSKYPRKLMERICGPFRDKNFRMYDFAKAGRNVCRPATNAYTCIYNFENIIILYKNIFPYFIPTSIIFFKQKIAGIIRRFFYFWILSYSGFCRKFFISVPFSNINGRVVSWLYSMSYFSMR